MFMKIDGLYDFSIGGSLQNYLFRTVVKMVLRTWARPGIEANLRRPGLAYGISAYLMITRGEASGSRRRAAPVSAVRSNPTRRRSPPFAEAARAMPAKNYAAVLRSLCAACRDGHLGRNIT